MDSASDSVLLTTAYLPPIQFISKFILYEEILLEQHENYQKQSYRNRCHIYGANGRQILVIPVSGQPSRHCRITEIRIDNEKKWQKNHWKAIESAYRLSPWFEFYADELASLFQSKADYLFEWNLSLIRFIIKSMDLKINIRLTEFYKKPGNDRFDFRYAIHPKEQQTKPDDLFRPIPYQQVFRDKYGVISNLSIIDLLFNEGPQAVNVITKSLII